MYFALLDVMFLNTQYIHVISNNKKITRISQKPSEHERSFFKSHCATQE